MTDVKRTLRVYADTSVFGGCFDDEFRAGSIGFFEEVRSGRSVLVVSDVTLDELGLAPESVRRILADLPPSQVEVVIFGGIERPQAGVSGCRGRRAGVPQRRGAHRAGNDFRRRPGSELELQTHRPF